MITCHASLKKKVVKCRSKSPTCFLKNYWKSGQKLILNSKLVSLEHFQEQNLWHNSLIRMENKPIFYKDWCSKGITKVEHLQNPDYDSYLLLNDFQLKYELNAAPLCFYGLTSAVKALGNSSRKQVNDTKQEYEPLSSKF